ncbi:FAD-binding protein [Jejubacter calystegiae]|uniref:FAD-binding protein n=1 Tax=Jejubacter calystegiae TaxID=2579935 RepID=A0A4P8YD27_9ENTR|nr:cholesterol oxidase substrate-binding domain-containing protein [Jejubacter calystegiae]QCT18381.1 FAD-binding protein [Jejubacter calystegiae]
MDSHILETFPVSYSYSDFTNWSKEVTGSHILTCAPANQQELLAVVNWAYKNNYHVRPVGMKHNWSTLTIANGDNNSSVLLVDLTKKLTKVSITKEGEHGFVTAQTGIAMQTLMTELEKQKLGFYATPAPGDLTLGGVLAIGGHGTCIPAAEEALAEGGSYGSVSNSIVSLSAVVWNAQSGEYELKTFKRDDAEIAAFMVHVGRALIFEATLQVPRNRRLRCQSYVNVPAKELFAAEDSGQRTFTHFLEQCGRAEIIWFPFTENPWLKIWTLEDHYPVTAKPVNAPFNYPFSDNLPVQISDLIKKINNGAPEFTPDLGKAQMELVSIGLGATLSGDLWGWSKDLLLYVKPSTLRVTANGYAIITRRDNIQRVLNDFAVKYEEMVSRYKERNSYPMNGPIEVRVTGLDKARDSTVANAVTADLSAIRPVDDKPEWDTAIWLDILTMPDTPDANKFYHEMETWIYSHFSGDYATVRVEWSKGWAYTDQAAWAADEVMSKEIPQSFGGSWQHARDVLDKYDPHYLFSSPLINTFFNSEK